MRRVTMSGDGVRRVDLRVQHRVSSDQLADALATDLYCRTDQRDLPTLTRAQAEQHIRMAYERYGSEHIAGHMADEIHECGASDDTAARARRAVDTVRKFWPQLDDQGLADFEKHYAGDGGQ